MKEKLKRSFAWLLTLAMLVTSSNFTSFTVLAQKEETKEERVSANDTGKEASDVSAEDEGILGNLNGMQQEYMANDTGVGEPDQDVDYSVWFDEGMRDDHFTWVFSDEEDYKIKLGFGNEGGFPDSGSLAWELNKLNSGEENGNPTPIGEDYYSISEENNSTFLNLNGQKLAELWNEGEENRLFEITVKAKDSEGNFIVDDNGEPAEGTYDRIEVAVWDPGYESYFYENDMLPTQQIIFEQGELDGFMQNKYFPWGETVKWKIDDAVLSPIEGAEEGAEPDLEMEKDEDGTITIRPKEGVTAGGAEVTLSLSYQPDPEDETTKITKTVAAKQWISTLIYRLDIYSSTGSTCLLPGASLDIVTDLWKVEWSEEAGENWTQITDQEIGLTKAGDDFVSLEGKHVTAGQMLGNCGVEAICSIPMTDDEGNAIEPYVASGYMDIWVTDVYYQLFEKDIVAEPGQTLEIPVEMRKITKDNPQGTVLSDAKLEGVAVSESRFEECLTINNDDTITINDNLTVDGTVVDEFPFNISLNVSASYEESYVDGEDVRTEKMWEELWFELKVCSHNFEQKNMKPAACTTEGSISYKCTYCDTTKDEIIPATGIHSYGEWTVRKPATALEGGVESRTCSVCGAAETREIPKLNAYVKLNVTNISLFVNQSIAVKVTEMAQGDEIASWSSSNNEVAAVSSVGEVQAKSAGKATITVTLKSGASAAVEVTVQKGYVKLNVKSIPLKVKQSTSVVKVTAMAEGDEILSWSSSNSKVATVSSRGRIKAKSVGKATITVTLKSGASASVKVKVQKGTVKLKNIKVNKKKLTLKVKRSYILIAQKNPLTAPGKLKFTSSNKKVATANNKGKIVAKKPGKTVITISCGAKKVKVYVTVKK